MRRSKLKVRFKYPGGTPANLRWSQMREMVDAIAEAVRSLAPEIDVDEIIPVSVEAGSIVMELQTPARTSTILSQLTRKPVDGLAPKLRGVARKYKADISIQGPRSDTWKPIEFEDPSRIEKPKLHGIATYVAFVENLGGEEPKVRLRLPNGEVWVVRADEELIRKLGPHIYQEIRAKLGLEIDATSGRVVSRKLVSFDLFEHHSVPKPEFPTDTHPLLVHGSVASLIAERKREAG